MECSGDAHACTTLPISEPRECRRQPYLTSSKQWGVDFSGMDSNQNPKPPPPRKSECSTNRRCRRSIGSHSLDDGNEDKNRSSKSYKIHDIQGKIRKKTYTHLSPNTLKNLHRYKNPKQPGAREFRSNPESNIDEHESHQPGENSLESTSNYNRCNESNSMEL